MRATGTEVFSRQNAAAHLKCNEGPVSVKSRELFGPEKPVVKLQSACFEQLIF